jgi:hypothetical protein
MPLLLVGPTKKARDFEKSQGLIASARAFAGEAPVTHCRSNSGRNQQGRKGVLRPRDFPATLANVPESVFEREDVDAILSGLWDIKVLLVRIAQSLGDDEEEEEEEA